MTDDDTHEGQLEVGSETALVSVGLGPGKVGELGVGRDTDDLGVDSGELVERGVEREDLGGTDDCEADQHCIYIARRDNLQVKS